MREGGEKVRVLYLVEVEAADREHCDDVIANRTGVDDDYGYEYTIKSLSGMEVWQ